MLYDFHDLPRAVAAAKRAAGRYRCPAYVVVDQCGYQANLAVVTERRIAQEDIDWGAPDSDDYSEMEVRAIVDPDDEGDTNRVDYLNRLPGWGCYPHIAVRNR